jgi:hypothetical protein
MALRRWTQGTDNKKQKGTIVPTPFGIDQSDIERQVFKPASFHPRDH